MFHPNQQMLLSRKDTPLFCQKLLVEKIKKIYEEHMGHGWRLGSFDITSLNFLVDRVQTHNLGPGNYAWTLTFVQAHGQFRWIQGDDPYWLCRLFWPSAIMKQVNVNTSTYALFMYLTEQLCFTFAQLHCYRRISHLPTTKYGWIRIWVELAVQPDSESFVSKIQKIYLIAAELEWFNLLYLKKFKSVDKVNLSLSLSLFSPFPLIPSIKACLFVCELWRP